jgi:spermidine synthase
MSQPEQKEIPITLVLLLFFVSGAVGLVYEVVWSRMMMHVFGSTALAVGTVLAAFMSGLALGAWLIGKLADRSSNCLRLYAVLEIGIALSALVSHLLLSRFDPVHIALFEFAGSSATAFATIRFLLAFLLVLVPTVFMGATLPVLTRFLAGRHKLIGIDLSTLYAINTLGAVTGVMLTGFFLIGKFGIHVPVYMAVTGNLLIGGIAWVASRSLPTTKNNPEQTGPDPVQHQDRSQQFLAPWAYRLILAGLGISGFTSFAYEIYWTRALVFILGNSTYALTMMLSAFLSGIALGGYLIRFLIRRFEDRAVIFGWVQVLLGVFSALALPLLFAVSDPQSLNQFLIQNSNEGPTLVFTSFGVAFLVMLIPATLIGTTFPLVGQIYIRDPRRAGSSVGRLYAINTLGNVLGALLPGLVLIAWLGIQKGILAMAALNIGIGFIILWIRLTVPSRDMAWRLALPALLFFTVYGASLAPIQFQFPSDGEQPYFQTLFYREGPLATTKVYLNPRTAEKHMSVDGIVIGGTGFSEYKQLLLAHLPKLLLKDVSYELSVGLGSGILAGESARHEGVAGITGIEIEPSVIEGAKYFEQENHGVLDNSRVEIVVDDIGSFLRTTSASYQVITADEKTADEYASNGFSYSRDYYELLRQHLVTGGLVAQWVPTTLPPRQYQMVLRTFAETIPYTQLWYFLPASKRGPFNTILIGSNEPILVDYDHIGRQFTDNREAYKSLMPYGLNSPEAVLPHFIADGNTILDAVSAAEINSLDHPRYEFFYPWDYAMERQKFTENHELIILLKSAAQENFLTGLKLDSPTEGKMEQTLAAEQQYLAGFGQFLAGMPLAEQYRIFDAALAAAPWNDSLRARIYAQYTYLAMSQKNPSERARLKRKADSLYVTKEPGND